MLGFAGEYDGVCGVGGGFECGQVVNAGLLGECGAGGVVATGAGDLCGGVVLVVEESPDDGGGHAAGSDECDLYVHVIRFGSILVDRMGESGGDSLAGVGGELDVASNVAKGVSGDGQAHAAADGGLGSGEWLEEGFGDGGMNAEAGVDDADAERGCTALFDLVGMNLQATLLAGGVFAVAFPGVSEDFAEDALEDFRVGLDGCTVGEVAMELDYRVFGVFVLEALEAVLKEGVDGQGAAFVAFVFSDGGELLDDVNHTVERVVGTGDIAGDGLGAVAVVFDQVEVADDDAEEVVEVVRNALGDGADSGGLAGVAESFLKVEVLAVHLL